MSIMNMFRSVMPGRTATSTGTGPTPTPESNNTIPSANTVSSDGKTPAIPATATGEVSPLSEYSKVWDTPANGTGLPSSVPQFTTDPAKLTEISKTIDFRNAIDPELAKKALTGDMDSFMQVLNQVGQAGFAQAAGMSSTLVQKAMTAQNEKLQNELLPEFARRDAISSSLRENNSLYSNPAIAPMLHSLEKQFSAAYPNASPQEVRDHATRYMQGVSEQVVAQSGRIVTNAPQASQSRGKEDWETFSGVPGLFNQ